MNTKIIGAVIVVIAIVAIAVGCWYIYIWDVNGDGEECTPAEQLCGRFDVNNDGVIYFEDLVLIIRHIDEPYDVQYDMDCDGDVDVDDVNLCEEYYGCLPVDGPCNC